MVDFQIQLFDAVKVLQAKHYSVQFYKPEAFKSILQCSVLNVLNKPFTEKFLIMLSFLLGFLKISHLINSKEH